MKPKFFGIVFLALISCPTCLGQTPFMGLTPGKSTKADVERVLGQVVRALSETLAEYKSDQEREQIFVQYRRDSFIIERIELVYAATIERSAVLRSLNLPSQSTAARTNSKGRLEEYFSTASVVLTYAGPHTASGVNRVGYYSHELFESASAADRTGRSSTSAANTPIPAESKPKSTTTTRSYPASSGRGTPMTVTTRSSAESAGELKPPTQAAGTTDTSDAETPEKEITLSEAELRKLVGRYEFIQSTEPSLKEASVTLVGGKLKLTMGAMTYTLIPIEGDDLAVGGRAKGDSVNFKIANKPGVKVSFLMSGNKVENLFYVEEKTEPMHFAVAVPKP